MNKREKRFYERFKKGNVTLDDLERAKGIADALGDISGKFRLLVRMIVANIRGEFKIPNAEKLKIIGAILYVVTPMDAVLDIIPFFGFTDDIAVVTYVLSKINGLITGYEAYEKEEARKKKHESINPDNLKVVSDEE